MGPLLKFYCNLDLIKRLIDTEIYVGMTEVYDYAHFGHDSLEAVLYQPLEVENNTSTYFGK